MSSLRGDISCILEHLSEATSEGGNKWVAGKPNHSGTTVRRQECGSGAAGWLEPKTRSLPTICPQVSAN